MENSFNNQRVLVTGGMGAIGSNLVNRLIDEGAIVDVIDDMSSGYIGNKNKKAKLYNIDISNEINLDYNYAYIFHCAAFFANQNSVDFPIRDLDVNGKGTLNILEFAVKNKKLKSILYTSSSCVYGSKSGELIETDSLGIFDTPYAITKYIGEKYCQFFLNQYELPIKIVRLFNSYGPGELPGKYRNVIPNFIQLALNNQPLSITGDGNDTRDFTFVYDVISGIINAQLYSKNGEIYNIGTGNETKIITLATKINKLTNNKAGIVFKEQRSWDHIRHRKADIKNTQELLHYRPQVHLEKGLEITIKWIKDNLNKE